MRLKRKAETGMQYVLRQTLLRRNQLLRRARRTQKRELKDELRELRQKQLMSDRWTRQAIKTERAHRREDWLCGPLAPQRDVGEKRDIYGTARQEILQPLELPKRLQAKDTEIGIVASDRVVIVRGLGRGQIGEVTEVNTASATCLVRGIRQADFPIPPWTPQAAQAKTKYQSAPLPIPLKDVRLVYPLTDTETGYTRDVVIRHIEFAGPHVERSPFSNLPKHTRYLRLSPTETVELDWPAEKLEEHAATEVDTTRQAVEHETYIPSPLFDRVFPSQSIVAELRDPYARNRASHELDFMKRKVLVDMRAAWERARLKRGGIAVGTPESEYWAGEMERREKERVERRSAKPDEETLRMIREERKGMKVVARA
jgi:large subunit ribosomal protein L24